MIPKNKLSKQVFLLWYILAATSLAFSGIYSILPFILRTPYLTSLLGLKKDFFKVSLIVHVNLGVLVWFLSTFALQMVNVCKEKFSSFAFSAFIISMCGSFLIILSPFIGKSEAILNNYVPILHNFTFIMGISSFLSGVSLQVILTLLSYETIKNDIIKLTIYLGAVIFIIAGICFAGSVLDIKKLNRYIDLNEYYELLFWGFGHILQYNYIQLVLTAWLFLVGTEFCLKNGKKLRNLEYANLCLVIIAPFAYLFLSTENLYYFFTQHMRYFGGALTLITAVMIAKEISKKNINSLSTTIFVCSLILIFGGGIIGYLINGINVTIPAHYHGVITGISVALMGLFYYLLKEMSFKEVDQKLAKFQIILYTIGQIIHITGLAISGGYGALRKSPDGILNTKAKIFMGIMGTGGLIALLGGILFIILIYRSLLSKRAMIHG